LIKSEGRKLPLECDSIAEIRKEIDAIDYSIIKLFGLRYNYVKHIVKYKDKSPESIAAVDRKKVVLKKRREWAIENGVNPEIFEEMFRNLIKHFIYEELKIVQIKPNN